MTNLHFPIYSYTAFKDIDLKYINSESKSELIRYDYFDLTKIDIKEKRNFLMKLYGDYFGAKEKGFEYKDYLLNRYFFKEFVIRETTDNDNQVRYIKYTLSNWNEKDKKNEYDTRVLTTDIYYENDDGDFSRDLSYKIKVGHKDEVLAQCGAILDKYINVKDNDYTGIKDENLYIIPLYFTVDKISINSIGKYIRISDTKKSNGWSNRNIYLILDYVIQSLTRFILFNFYMLDQVEENRSFNFIDNGNIISDNLISYIKSKPKSDKIVIIDMGKNMKLRMKTGRKNIYTHNNYSIRTLCDYKFQVSAHWHHYWIGSRKNDTQKRICKWVEAYYKNPKKEFRIIKEIVNMN